MTAKIFKLQQLSENTVCKVLGRSVDVHLHNDTVFVIRRIQEKVSEQQCPLHICFFETKKAYDAVNRNIIWPLLLKCSLPLV